MNNITITGSLGRDIELRSMPNGDRVGSFSVADSQGRDKPAIWWNCQLFGKRADSLAQYLTKGQQVTVAGSIAEREWTDKEGSKRKQMDIRVNDIALQGSRREQAAAPAQSNAQPAQPSRSSSRFEDMDDYIPFRDPLSYRGAHLIM